MKIALLDRAEFALSSAASLGGFQKLPKFLKEVLPRFICEKLVLTGQPVSDCIHSHCFVKF